MVEVNIVSLPESVVMPALSIRTIWRGNKRFDPFSQLEFFDSEYPEAMELIRLGGIYPSKDGRSPNMWDPYNQRTQKGYDEIRGGYTNIGEHVVSTGFCSLAIAKSLNHEGFIDESELDNVVESSLVHDASKRYELMRRDYARQHPGYDPYSDEAYAQLSEILATQGVNAELVDRMVAAGSETGHPSFKRFIRRTSAGAIVLSQRLITDQVIHLADDMTATTLPRKTKPVETAFLTPWERMVASDFPNRYRHLWINGVGFTFDGEAVDVVNVSKNHEGIVDAQIYARWQPTISNAICRRIMACLDPDNLLPPEYFVKKLVNDSH